MFIAFEMLQCHVQLRINAREIRRFTYETVGRMEQLALNETRLLMVHIMARLLTHSPIEYQQLVRSSLTEL